MLVETEEERPALVRVLQTAPRCMVPDQGLSELHVGDLYVVSTLSAGLRLPGGEALLQERALALHVPGLPGYQRAINGWALFEESEDALRAFLGTELALPDLLRGQGVSLSPEDASVGRRGVDRCSAVELLSTGPGHWQERGPGIGRVFGEAWAGLEGYALVRTALARKLWRRSGQPARYFAPSPAIIALIE